MTKAKTSWVANHGFPPALLDSAIMIEVRTRRGSYKIEAHEADYDELWSLDRGLDTIVECREVGI